MTETDKDIWVYVAGPMTIGSTMQYVHRAIHTAELLEILGFTPIIPQLFELYQTVIPHDHRWWRQRYCRLLKRCNALYRMEGLSGDADLEPTTFNPINTYRYGESEVCKQRNIPVFRDMESLIVWRDRRDEDRKP